MYTLPLLKDECNVDTNRILLQFNRGSFLLVIGVPQQHISMVVSISQKQYYLSFRLDLQRLLLEKDENQKLEPN